MLNLLNEKFNKSLNSKSLIKQIDSITQTKKETSDMFVDKDLSNKNFFSKYYLPENKQWINSIYTYNKAIGKSIPLANNLVDNLLKSFFNLINEKFKTVTNKKVNERSSSYRRNKSSINKVWLSKSETKHTNDRVIITIYMYNKKRNIYMYKLKKLYQELLLNSRGLETNNFLKGRNNSSLFNPISLILSKSLASKSKLFGKNTNKLSSLLTITQQNNENSRKKIVSSLHHNALPKKTVKTYNKKHNFYVNLTGSNTGEKNEKLLSYKSQVGNSVPNIFIKDQRNSTTLVMPSVKNGKFSNLDNQNPNGKSKYFDFVHKPSTTSWYNKPNLSSTTVRSTKVRLSNFIKVMEKNKVISIKDKYTALLNKHHLKLHLDRINGLNGDKKILPTVENSKYSYLNHAILAENSTKTLNNIYSVISSYNLSKGSLNTLYCSRLLSKLHFWANNSMTYMSTEKNIITLNLNSKGVYVMKNSLHTKNKKRVSHSLIKLYKQIYVTNEYKNNNTMLTNLLNKSIIETKPMFSGYKSKPVQKKIRKILLNSIHNMKKLMNIFNGKKNILFSKEQNLNGVTFASFASNSYLIKVYKKEIILLNLLKNISVYSYVCKNFFLQGLKNIISKIYKKRVELNIVNLKYIYLNSDIFTQSISNKLRSRRNRLLRLLKRSLNSVRMPRKNTSFYYKENKSLYNRNFINKYNNLGLFAGYISNEANLITKKSQIPSHKLRNTIKMRDSLNQWIYNSFSTFKNLKGTYVNFNNKSKLINNPYKLNNIEKTVIDSIKYKSVFGVRLEAAGRLTRRFTASRSVFKIKYIGSLRNTNSLNHSSYSPLVMGINKPNIQFTKIASKTRNGSFGLKGWVSGH